MSKEYEQARRIIELENENRTLRRFLDEAESALAEARDRENNIHMAAMEGQRDE
jgi:hypothetical protein